MVSESCFPLQIPRFARDDNPQKATQNSNSYLWHVNNLWSRSADRGNLTPQRAQRITAEPRKRLRVDLRAKRLLEAEGYSASYGARRLHQVQSVVVGSHHRDVPLRKEVAEVEQNFHVASQETCRDRLAHEEIEIRIRLP